MYSIIFGRLNYRSCL